ncbi:DUF1801 domain-containing protein [Marinomonas sp. 15G1-11]|uniref:DUF1801 domain-containing protein n=1 Tax=Marinomonas phaeophyticola TaxID=3004091 RepID=A0ABT4JVZ1_9GAMM|nr:DUF1801 domain-containing protein [Marinomonas sp. 15G1-11]MCZ2722544.1 DUF1801 domain-containing protein [Marinomonas sp. 15G1-11]
MEPQVKQKFDRYPEGVVLSLMKLRDEIFTVVKEESIEGFKETIKWGEPSYIAKYGSTLRFDWKPKQPDQYCLYFNCNTRLVKTFKEVYSNELTFAGNRAIILRFNDAIPWPVLRHCISMSLRYHQLKHLPLLGA